jgi:hypothetical protein
MNYRKYTPIFFLIMMIVSCGNDDESGKTNTPPVSPNMGDFFLQTSFKFDDERITSESTSTTFFNFENRPFRFIQPMLYLSRIALVDDQNDTLHFEPVLLMDEFHKTYNLGKYDTTKIYTELLIGFGLPHSINKGVQPIEFRLEDPLGPKAPSMWWSWADGYIFARIEGPTNHDHPPGTVSDMTFSWHIGFSEAHRWPISFPISSTKNLEVVFDLKELVDNVSVPDELFNVKIRRNPLDEKITNLMASCLYLNQHP